MLANFNRNVSRLINDVEMKTTGFEDAEKKWAKTHLNKNADDIEIMKVESCTIFVYSYYYAKNIVILNHKGETIFEDAHVDVKYGGGCVEIDGMTIVTLDIFNEKTHSSRLPSPTYG
jgi:hypothetical protein